MPQSEPGRLAPLPPPMHSPKPKSGQRGENRKPTDRRTTAGRFAVLNEFVDCSLAGLTKSELLVWLVLYRDTRSGAARTAQSDIARRSGVSIRSVQTAIAKLVTRGLLKCVHRGGLNIGPSRYRVLPSRSDETPGPLTKEGS
ncbi:helix-turn-helix domain-containing protein [Aeoliella sp. ICT_H6.2]|uniref:Helix-turn-helix domain-containing protein n=1 Tax=Aeoliella straminimaris TaxID=2954799 RepID=A0A9X2FD49_9BACT|nr:helix-turn-helix domain-containing protein [Aeoliella straminimaris]MCO6045907.1 helix-turn-helix domain-containing protein [Aeoliella straminimaris]